MFAWHLDPSVIVGLASLGLVYLVGVVWPRRATPYQALSFLSGVAALFLALESPLDPIGDRYLLSAHMVQHLVLVLVVPPLLIYGTPAWVLQPVARVPLLGALARRLTRGPMAFGIYNAVFALAHLPPVFDLTLRSEGVHIAEHLLFIATGLLAWWPILSQLREVPRLSYPFQMLYLFLATLPCGVVGALMTLSGVALYAPYASAPRIWGSTVMGDQQIAGLIMWIGGTLYYFTAFMIVFFLWAQHDEPEPRRFFVVKGIKGTS